MDSHKFDTITRFAANAPDRRNVLRLVGAAAVTSVAGAVLGSGEAAANRGDRDQALIVIGDVLSGNEIEVEVKNNNVAAQVCAVVQDINALFVLDDGTSLAVLRCDIKQHAHGND